MAGSANLIAMRVRHMITQTKLQHSDTGWSLTDMPPRFSPDLHEVAAHQSGMEMAEQLLPFRRCEIYSNGTVQRASG